MNYIKCKLYGLPSKKRLSQLLFGKEVKDIKKQSFFIEKISPFLLDNKRLVEKPKKIIKTAQRNLLKYLHKLDFPPYVFSGVPKRSYIDNINIHLGKNYFIRLDLSKFFPSISRDKVYKFFKEKLNIAPDIANILTNLTTIDLVRKKEIDKLTINGKSTVEQAINFLNNKKVKTLNHLITGSPLSPILSYLVNQDMFDELYDYAESNGMIMSVYIDDIAFSKKDRISKLHKFDIIKIIQSYGYIVNKEKTIIVNIQTWKRITGGIINSKGQLAGTKSLENKIKKYHNEIKQNDFTHIDNLIGCLYAMINIDNKYKLLLGQIKKIKANVI